MWKIDCGSHSRLQIDEAAQLLKDNEVVAFPTETVYGLGANARSEKAVRKIFEAKGRPSDNPLIIHIARSEQLNDLVKEIPSVAEKLMASFWPGPLTLVFHKKEGLSETATAGLSTVAVRMPSHPVALALIEAANLPIAAPSANTSGKPSPTTANHVAKDLTGKISGIVDGGETGVGVESTVVDVTGEIPVILRPGGVTREEIEQVVGEVKEDLALHNQEVAPKSPGMKYTHYAPDAPFVLLDGSHTFRQQFILEQQRLGKKVGILTTEESKHLYHEAIVITCGRREQLSTVAAGLYQALRAFDEFDVDLIVGEVFPRIGIGEAIMNRLMKAAGHTLIKED